MLLKEIGKGAKQLSADRLCRALWAAALCDCGTWRLWRPLITALADKPEAVRSSYAAMMQSGCKQLWVILLYWQENERSRMMLVIW